MSVLYLPDLMYVDGEFRRDYGLLVAEDGRIAGLAPAGELDSDHLVHLRGKALLPGAVNAHSHSFQRLIRGRAESRARSGKTFWSWRGTMYRAALSLTPEDVFDVARMAFLEMLYAGMTTVGEFHYLHNQPDGTAYSDGNEMAYRVMEAARSVGIRIVLLRAAYMRSGFQLARDEGQRRFFEDTETYLKNVESLKAKLGKDADPAMSVGIAPHSIRAVPLVALKEIADHAGGVGLPMHMHVSEQVAENEASVAEYGLTPIHMLARENILRPGFTAVHAIHIGAEETGLLRRSGGVICSCPTTERNLGDGILAAELMMNAGIPIAFGTDSQAQIDPFEDARQLDYHLRLQKQQRVLLDGIDDMPIARRLFGCVTIGGAAALGINAGDLRPDTWADFFTVDLSDITIAGAEESGLLSRLVFALGRMAIRDVVVQGKMVVKDGHHAEHATIVRRFVDLDRRIWIE